MTTFISLAISDTMFPDNAEVSKKQMAASEIQERLNKHHNATCEEDEIVSALNPSHSTTIDAIYKKFNLALPIPMKAPKVVLQTGDELIVIQAQLPRLAEGEVHSAEMVENAKIKFSLWTVK